MFESLSLLQGYHQTGSIKFICTKEGMFMLTCSCLTPNQRIEVAGYLSQLTPGQKNRVWRYAYFSKENPLAFFSTISSFLISGVLFSMSPFVDERRAANVINLCSASNFIAGLSGGVKLIHSVEEARKLRLNISHMKHGVLILRSLSRATTKDIDQIFQIVDQIEE